MFVCLLCVVAFFFSSRRRHTRCALVTGVQTCALPIWVSMQVPPELRTDTSVGGDKVEHGLGTGPEPALADIQAVLDRLAPEPTTARSERASCRERVCQYV